MYPRRVSKNASCLYMLGFLSGLAFIVLCGSSATYNGLRNTHSESHIAEAVVEKPLMNDLSQPAASSIGDIDIAILYETNELDVKALDIEPGTQVEVRMEGGGNVLDAKTGIANEVGSIAVKFELSEKVSSLGIVDFVVSTGSAERRQTYKLPPSISIDNTPTLQPPNTSSTPSPTIPSPPLTLPNTDTPIPTPSPVIPTQTPPAPSTPVPMESFYPNWRAEYYNNVSWTGSPAVVRDDPNILFDWDENSPIPGAIGQNWFSIRWTRQMILPEGNYKFILSADDQAEVYLNGDRLLSYMGNASFGSQATRYIQGHERLNFEVKYIEHWGNAHIHFYWEQDTQQGCCWTTTYYRGTTASGEPVGHAVLPGNDLRASWNPGENDPNVDDEDAFWEGPFSAHITRQLQAPGRAGNYHLCVYTHDNVRVWLDRDLLIDHQGCGERNCLHCRRVYMGKNPLHYLCLEYSHTTGEPSLGLLMTPAKDEEPWIGAFFNNPNLDGPPVAIRTAADIDFDWQNAAPQDTGLGYDGFSVRWQRPLELVYGQYHFHVSVDDGARLRVNDRTLIDQWAVGAVRDYTATYNVTGSSERVLVELDYFENDGKAVVKLWWDTPPPTPTATPTSTPSP